jgi:coenzyme F420-reducing hydrogenase delta subunit
LTWIGASDGIQFAETIHEMVAQVRTLGPSEAKATMVI